MREDGFTRSEEDAAEYERHRDDSPPRDLPAPSDLECERPRMAEPGSGPWARRCGECDGCKAARETERTAASQPLVRFELPLDQAERLAWMARHSPRIQGGDVAIAAAVDDAVRAAKRPGGETSMSQGAS